MTMPLAIRLLGPVEVEVDGEPLSVDTRKATALLSYLAVTGRPQDRTHLVDLLWPDYDEGRGRATLRRTLSTLKAGVGDGWILVDRNSVGLSSAGVELDVARLTNVTELHRHAEGESCGECVAALKEAVAIYRGDFMQGFVLRDAPRFDEWQTAQNEHARRALGIAMDRLVDAFVVLGDLDEAAAAAERRTALDPLNEPTYRALMQLHAEKGERGAVVETYRGLVAILERELGVEPLEETTELYRALSRGAAAAPLPRGLEPTGQSEELPFVGRAREWDQLVTAFRAGQPMVVGIEGEPGIGKTRFVEEFLEHARSQGAKTLLARSHEGEAHVAYGVLTEALRAAITSRVASSLSEAALRELARLLPELEVQPAEQPVAGRFYDAVRTAFEAGLRGPALGVIVFEDVHWSDEATLDALAYVARRVSETGICLICTWRSEEAATHELDRVVRDVPGTRVRLERFGADELLSLLSETNVSTDEIAPTAERLLQETEGVPYFVTEYIKSLRQTGSWEVPSTVREILVRRLRSVRGAAAQVLDAAAVIDRAVDFDLVNRVAGRTDLETADALDELARSGLMRASDDSDRVRYEFSHEKLRSVAYGEMSRARRHVLHRRTASALIAASSLADREGSAAAAIARHLELAGAGDEAAQYHRAAGRWAHGVFAHAAALDHFRHALALGDVSSEVHESIADVHVVQGDYAEAIASYETAAALSPRPEVVDRKLGALYLRRGEYDLAEAHLQDALERSQDEVLTTEILVDLSLVARRRGDDGSAERLAADAVARAAGIGETRLRARAENAAGMVASGRGAVDEAREHLQIAFDMATVADDLPAMIAALNNLALVERHDGNTDEAIELTDRALEACRRSGDRHREAALENNLADLFHDSGRPDRAMEHLKRATAIFAEVGADPHGPLPEVWKLVEW